jgi:polyferredoxin
MGAIEGVIAGSFIMFSLQFILSLFLGRALCGYICPVGGLQECLMLVSKKKAKNGKRNLIKYFLWVPWLGAIIALFVRAGGVSRVDFFFFISHGVSLYEPYSYVIYYGILILVIVLAMTLGKRAFCHCVCWMAPFMVIGTKVSDWLRIPKLHLKADKEKCSRCSACSAKCPMSLDVRDMVEREKMKCSECILCGECVDACNKKAITYSFRGVGDK